MFDCQEHRDRGCYNDENGKQRDHVAGAEFDGVAFELAREGMSAVLSNPLGEVQELLLLGDDEGAKAARPGKDGEEAEGNRAEEEGFEHAPGEPAADGAGEALQDRAGEVVGGGRGCGGGVGGGEWGQGGGGAAS